MRAQSTWFKPMPPDVQVLPAFGKKRCYAKLNRCRCPVIAPSLHAHPACATLPLRHIEYFHDHVRIENRFFDGVLLPQAGSLRPDLSRAGSGLEFKEIEPRKYLS
jgi:hypothetical protein